MTAYILASIGRIARRSLKQIGFGQSGPSTCPHIENVVVRMLRTMMKHCTQTITRLAERANVHHYAPPLITQRRTSASTHVSHATTEIHVYASAGAYLSCVHRHILPLAIARLARRVYLVDPGMCSRNIPQHHLTCSVLAIDIPPLQFLHTRHA